MVMYPEIQKRAQAELLAVVGPDRLPTLEDRERLPLTESILRETLRLYPVTPLGTVLFTDMKVSLTIVYFVQALAHYTKTDDIYNNQYIPKGSVVFGVSQTLMNLDGTDVVS